MKIEVSTLKNWFLMNTFWETSEYFSGRKQSEGVTVYFFTEKISKVFGSFIPRRNERASSEENFFWHMGF